MIRSILTRGIVGGNELRAGRSSRTRWKLRQVKQASATIDCEIWADLDECSCRVKGQAQRTRGFLNRDKPKKHPRSVQIVGTFSRSRSEDPIFTLNAWHSSLMRNGYSILNTHINTSTLNLDLPLFVPLFGLGLPSRYLLIDFPRSSLSNFASSQGP